MLKMNKSDENVLILGAGPAGLACSLELGKNHVDVTVVEKEQTVGGLCRTVCRDGNYFDIGGHRFFTKNNEIKDLWNEVLKGDVLDVSRRSRILFHGKYFEYPLNLFNVIGNLGLFDSLRCFLSYIRVLINRSHSDNTFEGWITNRFGRRLYDVFFRTYTEKVWGMPCSEISSDWAKQRISGMSMKRAIADAVCRSKNVRTRSLAKNFIYPTYGPGLFCEKLKLLTQKLGARYMLGYDVVSIRHDGCRVTEVLARNRDDVKTFKAENIFSSIPITELIEKLDPKPSENVMDAARALNYRSFIVVNILLDEPDIFKDNWIYVHDSDVKLARVQNYKNWSHFMVKDPRKTTLGLEYFVSEGDELWMRSDEDMIGLALGEAEHLGILDRTRFLDGFVVKVGKVYPVYQEGYLHNIAVIRKFLEGIENLQVMGRCGMFRYDNSDHALLSGIFAARNMLGHSYDLWSINTDAEYHEELGPYNKEL